MNKFTGPENPDNISEFMIITLTEKSNPLSEPLFCSWQPVSLSQFKATSALPSEYMNKIVKNDHLKLEFLALK